MFTLTPAAATQILSCAEAQADEPRLRIAAKIDEDGERVYGIGFDEERENDLVIECERVTILISPRSQEILAGTTLDFVELHAGEFQFIFVSPDEPDQCAGQRQPSGCSSCGSNGGCG